MTILAFVSAHPYVASLGLLGAVGSLPIWMNLLQALQALAASVASFLLGLVFENKSINGNFTLAVVTKYLMVHGKHFGINKETFRSDRQHIITHDAWKVVFWREFFNSFRFFVYRKSPILYVPYASNGNDDSLPSFRFLRWTVNWAKLVTVRGDPSCRLSNPPPR
jgi:hypothetical protein